MEAERQEHLWSFSPRVILMRDQAPIKMWNDSNS